MSTASSSPVPERSVGGHAGDLALTRIRRNLFGTPDPAATLKFLQTEIEKQHQYNACRWNFDFVAGKPLPKMGDHFYDWQPTTPTLTPVLMEDDKHLRLINESSENDDAAVRNHQTQITDYMRKRKLSASRKHPERRSRQQTQEDPGPPLTKVVRPSSA